jgi:class 3 adenylate cyclase/tetratricopeptide (TPR) repeat protein
MADDSGERRHVSVLFCDLADSTAMSEKLDPEDLRSLVRQYQQLAEEVIQRFDGHIAQYLGDGLLVYFGYPHAHEDDARRAVLTAQGIIEAIDRANRSESLLLPISVRIGIHTGHGVVGAVGGRQRTERLLIGQAPNLAARLQGEAGQNQILVSAATYKLIQGWFEVEILGERNLKGIEKPVVTYRIVGVASDRNGMRFAKERGPLSPLVGRERESEQLREALGRCREGAGQTLLIVADAGMGKSRLLHVIADEASDFKTLIARCSPYGENTSLGPLIDVLKERLGVRPTPEPRSALDSLAAQLNSRNLTTPISIAVPLLANAFSLDAHPAYPMPLLAPAKAYQYLVGVAIELVMHEARTAPIILWVEDLHWADPSTLDCLDRLMELVPGSRMLLLLTARRSFESPWKNRPYCKEIVLAPLSPEHTERIIEAQTGGKKLPPSVVKAIVEKTDGIPLYVEETTRAVLESNLLIERDDHYDLSRPMASPAIPTTLHDSLMARLDSLGPAKEVAQLASVIGRQFLFLVLARLCPMERRFLRQQIDQLIESGLVEPGDAGSEHETYTYKHALIQDAAYESLLTTQRKAIHLVLARAYEDELQELVQLPPEVMARHYEAAGMLDEATQYLLKSAQHAMQTGAHREALASLTRGVELLETASDERWRYERELALRVAMSGAIIATMGYTVNEFLSNAKRLVQLCARLGNPPEMLPVLYSMWVFNLVGSNRGATEAYADEILTLVTPEEPGPRKVAGTFVSACTHFFRGRFDDARAAFERALSSYSPQQHAELAANYGDDPGLFCYQYTAWLDLIVGDTKRALEGVEKMVSLAAEFGDPLSITTSAVWSLIINRELGNVEQTRKYADQAIEVGDAHGIMLWHALAHNGCGWAKAMQGDIDGGLADIESGIGFAQAINLKLPLAYWLGYKADVLRMAGKHDAALAVIDEALVLSNANVDSFNEFELLRLRAVTLREADPSADGLVGAFEKAIESARSFGAVFYEVRVAVSAAPTLIAAGQGSVARQWLEAALGRVPQGSGADTYEQARALLRES